MNEKPDEGKQEDMHMHLDHCRCYFIAGERLGLIESHISKMANTPGKRKRSVEFNAIAQVLKHLHVVERSMDIKGVSYGCLSSGEAGMFIICSIPERILGDIPGEPNVGANQP